MKKLFTAVMLFTASIVFAQNTITKVPKEASIVASIKGENLTQLMSIEELNNSFVMQEMLKELSRKEADYSSIEDFGINIKASSHYFFQVNDSIMYNAFIIPVSNGDKFDAFVKNTNSRHEFVNNNGIRSFKDNSEGGIIWNDNTLVIVEGSLVDSYFNDKTVAKRYGLKPDNIYGYTDDAVTEAIEVEEAETVKEASEEIYEEEEIEETVIESTEDNNTYNYYDSYNNNYDIKRTLSKQWDLKKAKEVLLQIEANSILKNKSYLSSIDNTAEATLWVNDFGKIYSQMLGSAYFRDLAGFNLGAMYADNNLTAKLFLEDDKMMLNTKYTMSDMMAKSYKKMSSRKLNKKFFDYVNEDKMIAYMSYAMDTKAMLEEYPKLMKSIYQNMPYYGEEAVLAIDLFSLLLDEEAVAEVLKGDMLFLLSGISKQEVTYTTYEYNDDYEYVEVEKKKTETLPDFLLMASSDDSEIITKLIKYSKNKEFVTFNDGFYTFKEKSSPISLHFLIKDDIIFVGTSAVEMKKIVTGTFNAKVSSKHKNIMSKNNYSMYVSAQQLADQLPIEEMGIDRSGKLEWFLNTSEDAYITASKIKGNTVNTNMVIGVPSSQENALKYIFDIIENIAK
ncbi:hypothetical protein [Olleya sp. ITB9]|uniref:hypothetical protein n=1 Tax=Olleya sp. ITB9 TaxID=1715648 RepID=UPI0006CF5750|nr:hypothetical protein [Olleya sp. ITB9]